MTTPVPAKSPDFLRFDTAEGKLLFPDEPVLFSTKHHIKQLFMWSTEMGASDITIQSGAPVSLKIYGRVKWVTKRALTNDEVMAILVGMYESESPKSKLSGADDLDFAYEIRPDRNRRLRYRVNATPIGAEGQTGIEITARTIPSVPPSLSDLNLEPEIIANLTPRQGMILVTGATGSGKTTLLAAIIRWIAENPDSNKKILTYESPIEFVYDDVIKPSTTIAQSEIGRHLPSFARGTRNALRRAPDIILIGEARDAETIGEAVVASTTGHTLYSTVHSNGFAETIRRMVNVFPENEKNGRALDIISSLCLVVSQRLVPSTDGKRCALREYVVMNDQIVDYLLDRGLENLTMSCREVLRRYGRSFGQDAWDKLQEGRISEAEYKAVVRSEKMRERDEQAQIEMEAQGLHVEPLGKKILPEKSDPNRQVRAVPARVHLDDIVDDSDGTEKSSGDGGMPIGPGSSDLPSTPEAAKRHASEKPPVWAPNENDADTVDDQAEPRLQF